MIEFAGLLCLIVALAAGVQLRRARSQLRQAQAVLDTVPLAWFCWTPLGLVGAAANRPYAEFLARLAGSDAERLESARRTLGTPFSITVTTRNGATYIVEGRRAASGEAVLWLVDASAAAAAEATRREAESLREMLDAVPVPVWRRAADRSLIDCNRAYARAVDTTRELALAEGRELSAAARAGERRHVVVGGSRRLLEIGEVPAHGAGTLSFAIDRTELETAEASLRCHLDAHAEVLQGIRAAVAIYGADKRLNFFNSAFASMWDLREEWLAAQPSFEEILERLREARRLPEAADFRAFKSEQLRLFTSVIKPQQDLLHLPDGRTLLMSISPHPFGGLTFVYEDFTDRLALERSCKTLRQVRRATLEHLFEGIAVFGSDGRLKLHNPAYLALWGLSEGEVVGQPHIRDVLERTRDQIDDGHDWKEMKRRTVAKITAHAPSSGPIYRNDGSMLQEATVPLPNGDVLVTYLDVTDTARVERALRERNEALETAGRLKSEFIAAVSHELRGPLNGIKGFAEILNKQYFGDLNPRQLDYTRSILHSANQLAALVDDTLDIVGLEAGHMPLESGRVEVLEMLQTVLALGRERARSRNLQLALHCPADIGVITADARRLKQAVFNLVSNAIKFTAPGGAVTVEAERRAGELLMTVADTGLGISQSDQTRLFEKFAEGARRSGAGLGLSLVKTLIELHGGKVAIETAPGRGTRILCRLPASPVEHEVLRGWPGADGKIAA